MTPRPFAPCTPHRPAMRRRRPHTGRGRTGRAALGLCLLAAVPALLAGCTPTEGDTGVFEPLTTTFTEFASPTYYTVGNEPWYMDVDTSGLNPRVAVVNRVGTPPLDSAGDPNPGTVMVLDGDGAGSFNPVPLQIISAGNFPTQVFWANIDKTGDPDLVIVSDLNRKFAVHLSTGPGAWSATPDYSFQMGFSAAQVTIADLDGDGDDDVVMTVPRDGKIVALFNEVPDPAATMTLVSTTVSDGLGRFAWGQFNKGVDTNLDLAITRITDNTVHFYQWNGTDFSPGPSSTSPTMTATIADIAAADLDGDGDTDLAVLSDRGNNSNSQMTRLDNNGSGIFTVPGYVDILERGHRLLPLGDVITTSASPEIAVLHTNQRYISVLQGSGAGFAVTELDTSRNPVDAVSADVAGQSGGIPDGNQDIITVEEEKRALGIFQGNGLGSFTRWVVAFDSILRSPHAVDLNGTGNADDLIVVQPYMDRVVILNHN